MQTYLTKVLKLTTGLHNLRSPSRSQKSMMLSSLGLTMNGSRSTSPLAPTIDSMTTNHFSSLLQNQDAKKVYHKSKNPLLLYGLTNGMIFIASVVTVATL